MNMRQIVLSCLVDHCVQQGSNLWGEPGAAFWIETPQGQVLFDTGKRHFHSRPWPWGEVSQAAGAPLQAQLPMDP
jgi:hypothetical protein